MTDEVIAPEKKKRLTFMERQAARMARYEVEIAARKAAERAQWIAEMDAMGDRFGVCYFIGWAGDLVKIGYSSALAQRFGTICRDTPFKIGLMATAAGGRDRERHYHRRFEEHRAFGEWFERCPEIEAEIERLAATAFHAEVCAARGFVPAYPQGRAA